MSIQSVIDSHFSEAGFFSKSINITKQSGSCRIPDGAHVRFFECDIDEITSVGSTNQVYITKGSLKSLNVSNGEYSIIGVDSIENIDVNGCKVLVEDTTITGHIKAENKSKLEFRNVTFTCQTLFDCTDTNVSVYNCSSTSLSGGVISGGRVHLENMNSTFSNTGISFLNKSKIVIANGSFSSSGTCDKVLDVNNSKITVNNGTTLSSNICIYGKTNSKVECNNITFEGNTSIYLDSTSIGMISNVASVPPVQINDHSECSIKSCGSITDGCVVTNYSSLNIYSVPHIIGLTKAAISLDDNCNGLIKDFVSITSDDYECIRLDNSSKLRLVNFEDIRSLHNGSTIIVLNFSRCDVSQWTGDISGIDDTIDVYDGTINITDGTSIICSSGSAISLTSSSMTGFNVDSISSNTGNAIGIIGSTVSLINVDSITSDTGNGIDATNSDIIIKDINEVSGSYGIKIDSSKININDVVSVSGIYTTISDITCNNIEIISSPGLYSSSSGKKIDLKDCSECSSVTLIGMNGTILSYNVDGQMSCSSSSIDSKDNTVTGSYVVTNSYNNDTNCNYSNIVISEGVNKLAKCSVSGYISGQGEVYLDDTDVTGSVVVHTIHASNSSAASWNVSIGSWKNCSGSATTSIAGDKQGGTTTVNGLDATVIRYSNGSLLDYSTDTATRIALNGIHDQSSLIYQEDIPT